MVCFVYLEMDDYRTLNHRLQPVQSMTPLF
jgi:hypothetical protein